MATGFLPEFSSIQQGLGVPTHQAQNGTVFLDRATGLQYFNTTGGTTWVRVGVGSGNALAQTLITTTTLTAADSGKPFFLNLAGGFTVNLPSVAFGLKFTFIVKTAPTTAYILLAEAVADHDTIIGWPINVGGADSAADGNAAGDQINFVANVSLPGDRVDLECDGAFWYARATAKLINAITITG